MNPITNRLPYFPSAHPWANCILRIDLDHMAIDAHESTTYVPEYLGVRGPAARICWEEYLEPVEPFSPANPLNSVPAALKAKETLRVSKTLRVWKGLVSEENAP